MTRKKETTREGANAGRAVRKEKEKEYSKGRIWREGDGKIEEGLQKRGTGCKATNKKRDFNSL